MGTDKASLIVGGKSLLSRTCERVSAFCDSTVVVAAARQSLPSLPDSITTVADLVPDSGPLVGLLSGMQHLVEATDSRTISRSFVFLSSCDSPFVSGKIAAAMTTQLAASKQRFDAHVLVHDNVIQPFHAVYSLTACNRLQAVFESGERSMQAALKHLRPMETEAATFIDGGGKPTFLMNLNTIDDVNAAERLLENAFWDSEA